MIYNSRVSHLPAPLLLQGVIQGTGRRETLLNFSRWNPSEIIVMLMAQYTLVKLAHHTLVKSNAFRLLKSDECENSYLLLYVLLKS